MKEAVQQDWMLSLSGSYQVEMSFAPGGSTTREGWEMGYSLLIQGGPWLERIWSNERIVDIM